ncbi:MAG: glycosyl transferase family 2 [Candidatus Brocadiaceae bacterium]|nr:glycosyl transferase family 2 [Candidatus Brocadiaceae bacterium]
MAVLISVVICTHNRAGYLLKAIQSLICQRLSKDKYEIIIVDNCSTDSTREVTEQLINNGNIRYLYEPALGLSFARNTGWRNANGNYVAYLDDDAVACPIWLEKIIEVFETVSPRPGCVGGRVEPIWESSRPAWLSDWLLHGLTIIDWSDTPHVLTNLSTEWLAGANIAFPLDILKDNGGFTAGLDRVGNNLLSSGDIFFEKQLVKMGYSCFYHPAIAVGHHIFKSRLSQSWFIRRYYWQGVSDVVMQLLQERPPALKRFCSAVLQAKTILQSPEKVLSLLLPTNDPDKFTQKCFTFITLGHIYGLLRVAKP